MKVTDQMRAERALKHLEAERVREQIGLDALDGIHIREVIIMRNKKAMYMAELEQMIRKLKETSLIPLAAEG